MIGIILINAAAEYIVFPLSFTSVSDLSAPSYYPPWTHCTLTQIPSGQSSCCFKPKVTVLKRHASVVCVCLCICCCISLYPQLLVQRSRLLVPPPTLLGTESKKTLTMPTSTYKGALSFRLHLLPHHHVPSPLA